jgi:Histidine kinase
VRIARDLHDSAAHSLASISVQAGVGAHVIAAARALFRRAVDAGLINTNPAAALRKPRRSRSRRRGVRAGYAASGSVNSLSSPGCAPRWVDSAARLSSLWMRSS